ncbi:MAG: adenosylmethionine decarboxylase [Proteobacteria bacterium]|nr:adenosylmethionine decarboxylase [Pseudomonadota bacterium]
MQGLHLTADLYGCRCDAALLDDAQAIALLCCTLTDDCDLSVMADRWVTFPGLGGQRGGVTGVVLLAESHVAIHTWPELGNVTLDIYVCNFSGDNSAKAEQLMQNLLQAYQADRVLRKRLLRGDLTCDGPS